MRHKLLVPLADRKTRPRNSQVTRGSPLSERGAMRVLEKWRRARDSNPQGPCGPVDFKSCGLVHSTRPKRLGPRFSRALGVRQTATDARDVCDKGTFGGQRWFLPSLLSA